VAPHEDGSYDLEFFLGDARSVRRLAGPSRSFTVDFRPRLRALRIRSCESLEALLPGRLVRLRFGLENPLHRDLLAGDDLLAAVVPVRPQDPPPSLAEAPLSPVRLEVPARGRADLEVFVRTPWQPGPWRMDLVLAPAEGGSAFLSGPGLEVGP